VSPFPVALLTSKPSARTKSPGKGAHIPLGPKKQRGITTPGQIGQEPPVQSPCLPKSPGGFPGFQGVNPLFDPEPKGAVNPFRERAPTPGGFPRHPFGKGEFSPFQKGVFPPIYPPPVPGGGYLPPRVKSVFGRPLVCETPGGKPKTLCAREPFKRRWEKKLGGPPEFLPTPGLQKPPKFCFFALTPPRIFPGGPRGGVPAQISLTPVFPPVRFEDPPFIRKWDIPARPLWRAPGNFF